MHHHPFPSSLTPQPVSHSCPPPNLKNKRWWWFYSQGNVGPGSGFCIRRVQPRYSGFGDGSWEEGFCTHSGPTDVALPSRRRARLRAVASRGEIGDRQTPWLQVHGPADWEKGQSLELFLRPRPSPMWGRPGRPGRAGWASAAEDAVADRALGCRARGSRPGEGADTGDGSWPEQAQVTVPGAGIR